MSTYIGEFFGIEYVPTGTFVEMNDFDCLQIVFINFFILNIIYEPITIICTPECSPSK
jgi:hypothetical protein